MTQQEELLLRSFQLDLHLRQEMEVNLGISTEELKEEMEVELSEASS
jgi:hypothetical protein